MDDERAKEILAYRIHKQQPHNESTENWHKACKIIDMIRDASRSLFSFDSIKITHVPEHANDCFVTVQQIEEFMVKSTSLTALLRARSLVLDICVHLDHDGVMNLNRMIGALCPSLNALVLTGCFKNCMYHFSGFPSSIKYVNVAVGGDLMYEGLSSTNIEFLFFDAYLQDEQAMRKCIRKISPKLKVFISSISANVHADIPDMQLIHGDDVLYTFSPTYDKDKIFDESTMFGTHIKLSMSDDYSKNNYVHHYMLDKI